MANIPQDWFIGKDHPFSRIAWFLQDNEAYIVDGITDELVDLLIQLEENLEVEADKARLEITPELPPEEKKLMEKAKVIVLKEAKEKAKADGKKATSNCLYTYYDGHVVNDKVKAEFNNQKRLYEKRKQEKPLKKKVTVKVKKKKKKG